MANKFRLKQKAAAIDKAFKESITIAGKDAVAHFKKSFDHEGFTDENFSRWKPRRGQWMSVGASVRGSRGALPNTKKTLTKTGALKRSIRIAYNTGMRIMVWSNLPYSAIHNEGLTGRAWGRHSFRMPKRKFLGNSRNLERRTLAKLTAKVNTASMNA